jgi:hypothetical protein
MFRALLRALYPSDASPPWQTAISLEGLQLGARAFDENVDLERERVDQLSQ